jgi:hypothetical protein
MLPYASVNSFHEVKDFITSIASPEVGRVIDAYNNVPVYYNGDDMTNVVGRNLTPDGYNLGLKYQCVEYVKRYYYHVYDHKMTNSYGHAKAFFEPSLPDKMFNMKRGLYQFRNGSEYRPMPGDILVFGGNDVNPFGHIGIVSYASQYTVEIIQQNVGEQTRSTFSLSKLGHKYYLLDADILGWLRKGG